MPALPGPRVPTDIIAPLGERYQGVVRRMSVSLYRKYRPSRFEDIIGQEHVARTLANAIKHDRVSHAYLFTGPRGTGKTSTAKILAMALNCDAGGGKATATPDGTCPHCQAIRRGSSLDVVEMDAASNRGIDDIRDLRDKVHFSPVEGRMKVYIVDEVHMLTLEAFNALLKTLEEPPVHAVFVLATTEPHKVPATILSRCQRFDFRRPSVAEVVAVLSSVATQEGIEAAEASLMVIARAAGGSFRDAIGILDQLATYSDGTITLEETLDILGVVRHDLLFEIVDLVHEQDTQGALLFAERLSQSGTDFVQFMKDLLGHLRDLYVVKHTVDTPVSMALTDEQLGALRNQAARAHMVDTVAFIDLLGEALRAVRQGSDPRLELELALIKMTALESTITGRPTSTSDAHALSPAPAKRPRSRESEQSPPSPAPKEVPSTPVRTPDRSTAQVEPSSPAQQNVPTSPHQFQPDLEHLRRAWPLVIEAVKKRHPGLPAVLSEGRPESIEDGELVIRFPAGYSFQASQVSRGGNPKIIAEALHEVTGSELRVSARLASEPAPPAAEREEDARILSKDELIRVLQQEFDAHEVDNGPARQSS